MSSLIQKAKGYVKKDGLSVIPVGKDKRPLISWKEFQERYASEEEIDEWFRKFPDAQIGIVTGKISNLTVVDIEKGGDASFLPQDTFIVKTGGGGWHYYYKFAEGIQNKARIRELVDIRGEGGYVVAPPSETEKGPYTVVQIRPPMDFPRHLFQDQKPSYQPPSPSPEHSQTKEEIEEYPGYGQGQRNEQMARYIGHVLRRVHPAEWDTKGRAIVEKANLKNTPPLNPRELDTTFQSIRAREFKSSQDRFWYKKYHEDWKGEEEQEPVNPEDERILKIAEVAELQKINIDDVYPFGMEYFDAPLMGGALPGDLIIIAGPTGNGKTLFSQDLVYSLTKSEKKVSSLFFSFEVLPQFVWQKFKAMGASPEDPIYIPMRNRSGAIDWIEQKIREAKELYNVKCVCIDHLGFLEPKRGANTKVVGANYSTFLTQVARDLKQIAIREEVIMITPAHVRKTEDLNLNDIANSAGIGQEADAVFLIERERNKSKEATSYYTDHTRIMLAKNRRTGQSVVGWFTLFNGKFCWDVQRNKSEAFMNELPDAGQNSTTEGQSDD
jgi:archaellum biogenesis ATPase FlaH